MARVQDVARLFTPEELEEIREAVDAAEGETSGEIVPYVVGSSDEYDEVQWKGAALGALLFSLTAAALRFFGGYWGLPGMLWIALPPALGAATGWFLAAVLPPVRRLLVSAELAEVRVRRRAALAFLDEEVFRTRERTGILLFLSLFERRVVVLGDQGINRRVDPAEWQDLSDRLARGAQCGRPATALVTAIRQCGALLARRGVERREDDTDELQDGLRLQDR